MGKFPMSNRGFRDAFAVAAGLSALALGFSVQAQPQATIAHGSSVPIPPGATVTISGHNARMSNNGGLRIGGQLQLPPATFQARASRARANAACPELLGSRHGRVQIRLFDVHDDDRRRGAGGRRSRRAERERHPLNLCAS